MAEGQLLRDAAACRDPGDVRSLDVAPTIAALLGIDMKDVEGRVLTEALVP